MGLRCGCENAGLRGRYSERKDTMESRWTAARRRASLLFAGALWLHGAFAAAQPAGPAAEEVLLPGPGLLVQGVPPVPMQLAEQVSAYADFRGHAFVAWHPSHAEMLVSHRPAGTNAPQLFRLREPMGAAEQLTSGIEPVTRGSYEPLEGRYLVYQRAPEGSEAFRLYRLDLEGGGKRAVTGLSPADEACAILGWLPGSPAQSRPSQLLYLSQPLGRGGALPGAALWAMDPLQPGGPRRKLADLPGVGWSAGGVSADGLRLALNRSDPFSDAGGSSVWVLDTATGQLGRLLPKEPAGPAAVHESVGFSADGKRLFLVTDKESEFRQLMSHDFESGRLDPLQAPLPWDVQAADLSADGKWLAFAVNVEGRSELRLVDTDGLQPPPPQPSLASLPAGTVRSIAFGPQARQLAVAVSNQKTPGQIQVLDLPSGEPVPWTRAQSPAGLDPAVFAGQQVVRWTTFDGRELSGLLAMPPAARFPGKRPVLLVMHGGPAAQATAGFLNRWNYLVQELGVAILEPNVRGSSGFGKSFAALDDGVLREDAVRDVGALLDWIALQPGLDASRVLVTGAGYGGYMAMAAAATFNDRIAGTLALGAPGHLAAFLAHAEGERLAQRRAEFGDERDPAVREFFEKTAPLNQIDKIAKPLFIALGGNETGAEQVVQRLKDRGPPLWYLRADDGAGFSRRENADFLFLSTVKFVEEVLLKP